VWVSAVRAEQWSIPGLPVYLGGRPCCRACPGVAARLVAAAAQRSTFNAEGCAAGLGAFSAPASLVRKATHYHIWVEKLMRSLRAKLPFANFFTAPSLHLLPAAGNGYGIFWRIASPFLVASGGCCGCCATSPKLRANCGLISAAGPRVGLLGRVLTWMKLRGTQNRAGWVDG